MDSIEEIDISIDFSDPVVLSIVVGGLLFVLFLCALLWRRAGAGRRNTVLFVGLSESGKTLVLSRFATGERVDTFTSMQENRCTTASGKDDGRHWQLVDVPGAERVRKNRLAHWLGADARKTVAGVVLLVDSSTYGRQARDVAELLYELLVNFPAKARLLVACNKQDVPLAKSVQVVRSSLEKELTLLAKTRAAALLSTDGDAQKDVQLPLDDQDQFKWDNLDRPQVEFVECRALDAQNPDDDSYDLDEVKQWIETLA